MTAQVVIALLVSVLSAVTAVVSITIGARAARGTARVQYELELAKSRATKQELVEEVMARYREPLLRAAFDLQSRIFNIVRQDFLLRYASPETEREQKYALNNTMYVFAEYLGWVEIMRRDVQFLDLGDVERNRLLVERLEHIGDIVANSTRLLDPTLRLFRGEQRAAGEVMVDSEPDHEGDSRHQCIGYARFVAQLDDSPEFAQWFKHLGDDLQCLMREKPATYERLTELQHALVDLIEFLDNPPVRFMRQSCTRI